MSTHERTPGPRLLGDEESSDVARPNPSRRKLSLPRPTSPPGRLSALNLPPRSEVSEVSEGIYSSSDTLHTHSSEGHLPNPDMLRSTDASEVNLEELAFSWANDPLLGVELLGGRYVIESVIGEGGYGVVYRAVQRTTGQFVAVKVLRRDKLSEHDNITIELARFEREMRLIGQLNHPNIVRLIDYGRLNADNLFTILEYIDGVPLSDLLHDEGALSPYEARALMLQVLEALGAAHELGIVYRDLKPHNLMITTSGVRRSVKLLDFGISGLLEDARDSDYENLTQEGVINGTPAYMAPEQLHGWALTPQSDIYSWGLVFLEMLMGRKAVQGASYVDVLAQQISTSPIEIPQEIMALPIGPVLARAVAKPLGERYQDVGEALYELEDSAVAHTTTLPWTGASALTRLQASLHLRQQRGAALGAGHARPAPTSPHELLPAPELDMPDAEDRTLRSTDLDALGLPEIEDDAISDVIDEMMESVWTQPVPRVEAPPALEHSDAEEAAEGWVLEEIPHPLDWTPELSAQAETTPEAPALDLSAELDAVSRAYGIPPRSAPEPLNASPPRGRLMTGALIALVLFAIVGVGAWWTTQQPADTTTNTPGAVALASTRNTSPVEQPATTTPAETPAIAPAVTTAGVTAGVTARVVGDPHDTTRAPEQPATTAEKPAPKTAEKPAPKTAPKTASLQIAVVPEDARIELDGQMLGRGAVKLVMPDDGSVHTLSITADGHKPYTQRFIGALEIKELRLEADEDEQPRKKRRRRRRARRRSRSTSAPKTAKARNVDVSVPGLKNPWGN